MDPVWRDIGKWHEDEGTLMHARVWKDEAIRGPAQLLIERQSPPFGMDRRVGNHGVTGCNQIQIERSLPPTDLPLAAKIFFYVVKDPKHFGRVRRPLNCKCGIQVVRAISRWKRGT